jgi:chromosome segregation ATPase
MEIVAPIVLVLLGLGATCLALGGLVRLGKERPDFRLFGLGVHSRLGALAVLAVSLALFFLAYSFWRQDSLIRGLQPELEGAQQEARDRLTRLEVAARSLQDLQAQVRQLTEQKQEYRRIAGRRRSELAAQAKSLEAALHGQQQAAAGFQESLAESKRLLEALQRQKEAAVQDSLQLKQELRSAESRLALSRRSQEELRGTLSRLTAEKQDESTTLQEEIRKLEASLSDQRRRAGLLREGLVSREAHDWSLEQEIEKLDNLISGEPEASFTRQTDIARTLQRIHELLREGAALAQQAKAAETRPRRARTVSADSN